MDSVFNNDHSVCVGVQALKRGRPGRCDTEEWWLGSNAFQCQGEDSGKLVVQENGRASRSRKLLSKTSSSQTAAQFHSFEIHSSEIDIPGAAQWIQKLIARSRVRTEPSPLNK